MADPHTDQTAPDYKHGQMEISEQERTWEAFIVIAKWGTLGIAMLIFFLTLWFGVGTGFLGAFVAAGAGTAIGILALKSKRQAEH